MTMQVSLFQDRTGSTITRQPVAWPDFVREFSNPPEFNTKGECILFSLCEFGDTRTDNGSLRSNDNVQAEWGVCGDYDGEHVTAAAARDMVTAANLRALIYTSPSNRADAPRWRVVCPYAEQATPERHAEMVERLNGVLGGCLTSESFTLSQPFYIGRVVGNPFEAYAVEGSSIDTRGDLPRIPWIGSRNSDGTYRTSTADLVAMLQEGREVHPPIALLAARGFTADELVDIVERYSPGWPRPERAAVAIASDIPRAVGSWQRKQQRELEKRLASVGVPPPYEQPPGVPPRRSRFVQVAGLIKEPQPLVWLIRDILEHPTLCVVFGESGAGKSYLTVDWGMSIAAGIDWNGHKVTQGRVAYMIGEGFPGMKRRYKAWTMKNNVNPEAIPFHVTERAYSLIDDETFYAVQDDLDNLPSPPTLIIIDTLTRHAPGMDQNSNKEVPDFVRRCDDLKARYGATVLIVAHSGLSAKDRVMGSVTLKGTLDVEMSVLKAGNGYMRLKNTKMKDGEQPGTMKFKFERVNLPWMESVEPGEPPRQQHSSVLVQVPDSEPKEGKDDTGGYPEACDWVLQALAGGSWIAVNDARAKFKVSHGGKPNTASKSFNRALRRLVEGGRVLEDEANDTVRLVMG